MYSINNFKYKNMCKLIDRESIVDIQGFPMGSKARTFKINGSDIKSIQVMERKLANPLASKKAFARYNKLIAYLTELLIDDDDSGDSFREALNQIEKFRLEIKNKYRDFLKQKELEMMSKQLTALKKEAMKRLMEIQDSYINMNTNNRSK